MNDDRPRRLVTAGGAMMLSGLAEPTAPHTVIRVGDGTAPPEVMTLEQGPDEVHRRAERLAMSRPTPATMPRVNQSEYSLGVDMGKRPHPPTTRVDAVSVTRTRLADGRERTKVKPHTSNRPMSVHQLASRRSRRR